MQHLKMSEQWLPITEGTAPTKGANNIFLSSDFYTNTNKCLILIQGTGPVRAGIWARYCCMNETLDLGSVIPFVKRGASEGYSCIVLNPNLNYDTNERLIRGSESMEEHCVYVWENFIRKCPAKRLYIVAHSAGGYCTSVLLHDFTAEFTSRVQMVALTDSWMHAGYSSAELTFMKEVAFDAVHFHEISEYTNFKQANSLLDKS